MQIFVEVPISKFVYPPASETAVSVGESEYFKNNAFHVPKDGMYQVRFVIDRTDSSRKPKLNLKITGGLHSEDWERCPMELWARVWDPVDMREGDRLEFLVINETSDPLPLSGGYISIFRIPVYRFPGERVPTSCQIEDKSSDLMSD